MSSLHDAIDLAVRAHRGQDREGDDPLPYVTHPMDVLHNVRYLAGVTDRDMLIAAILHDTVEETSVTLKDIERLFGERAAALVGELTRREPEESETAGWTKEEIWKLRAKMLVDEIALMSAEAQVVKLADRLSNVQEGKRIKKGKKLERYLAQTRRILETVPRSRSPKLWDAIKSELAAAD